MDKDDLGTPIFGLFGEVGSLLATLKKKKREGASYATYDEAIREELGDVLWYLCTVASHSRLTMPEILASGGIGNLTDYRPTFRDLEQGAPDDDRSINRVAEDLAVQVGDLLGAHCRKELENNREAVSLRVFNIIQLVAQLSKRSEVTLEEAAKGNLRKIFGRWPVNRDSQDYPKPPATEADLPRNERFPRQFEMLIKEQTIRGKTYVYQMRNDVIIGDRLTDNIAGQDDYRFHDVFHIAYAVHLEWSPVLRSLFKLKRKSRPELDENEDGARAILIEEGISTLVFGRARKRHLFEGLDELDYDLLKLVQEFVRGFEAERFAAWQWERAILDGFRVFREMIKEENRGGWIVADLDKHTLDFRRASGDQP